MLSKFSNILPAIRTKKKKKKEKKKKKKKKYDNKLAHKR
jgi:hypothetical protein